MSCSVFVLCFVVGNALVFEVAEHRLGFVRKYGSGRFESSNSPQDSFCEVALQDRRICIRGLLVYWLPIGRVQSKQY